VKTSLQQKLAGLHERHAELARLLAAPEAATNTEQFRRLSTEYSQLEDVARSWQEWLDVESAITASRELLEDPEAEVRTLAREEIQSLDKQRTEIEQDLQIHLLPRDPHDEANVFLEIRAGTGGEEAAIFAGDLLRMYSRYAETQRWRMEILSASESDRGGFREVVTRIVGQGAYSRLKFESGAHRVQRVPTTESQGRIHTSAATVAVMPELDAVEMPEIRATDLRIDTYRASGAGGQHVNRTDSAVRLTHLPTGLVVECQDERSQHKNKARAMNLLAARLFEAERSRQAAERSAERRSLVGSGDRSERIRTYNFPQGRITDHRINLTLYKLENVMDGELDPLIEPLTREHQAEQLAALAEAT
jgi:peptide chain release factor 1